MSEYEKIFVTHIQKLMDLHRQQRSIRSEIDKIAEMVKSSFALMSSEEQTKFTNIMQAALVELVNEERGLTDAIRKFLESRPTEWSDAVKVRDGLLRSDFDFSNYTSNPLASIHTVLKRFKRSDVKMRKNTLGVSEYRWASRKKVFGIAPETLSSMLQMR